MRVIIWAILSAVAFLAALVAFFTQLPYGGGGSIPYESYASKGSAPMLLVAGALFVLGIVLLVRRARRNT